MKVDRSRFLELVTLIAGAPTCCACATTPPEQPVVSVPLDNPIADTKPSAPIASAVPTARPAPSEPAPLTSTGIWALPYDPAAAPKTCSQLKCPRPTQEGMGALRRSCKTLSEDLRPEAFQHFMTCMMNHNNTRDTCDLMLVGTTSGECLEGWSSPPSVDPTTVEKCKPIVAGCANASPPLTMVDCQGLFTVTTPKAERRMIHCAAEYCSTELCHIRL